MRSRLFYSDAYLDVQRRTLALLNAQEAFLSTHTLHSPRATGDAVQDILASTFAELLGDWSAEYSSSFARRAMADLAFRDIDDNYYVVDVKTHRSDTKFNMPNLTSVERLARFYEDDSNYFVVLMVRYSIKETRALFSEVMFVPIEFLDWRCLTLGALGWGQIQIANSNRILLNPHYSHREWMLELCDILLEFYPKEIAKVAERIRHFETIRTFWLAKAEA